MDLPLGRLRVSRRHSKAGSQGSSTASSTSPPPPLLPVPGAYVKVFFRPKAPPRPPVSTPWGGAEAGMQGRRGEPHREGQFYKDGYTDRRGWFDYATVSTHDVEEVGEFALLVVAEGVGSAVRQVKPPQV